MHIVLASTEKSGRQLLVLEDAIILSSSAAVFSTTPPELLIEPQISIYNAYKTEKE